MQTISLEQPESYKYYQELHSYLKTQMNIISPEHDKPEKGPLKATKVVISIENTAPVNLDGPIIVFIGVGLSVAHLGGDIQTIKPQLTKQEKTDKNDHLPELKYINIVGKGFPEITSDEQDKGEILFPGHSLVYEMNIPSQFIPYVQFRVEGTVSRRYLYHFVNTLVMPDEYTKPVVIAALQAFNKIKIHKFFESILKSMPDFNSDTRLADIQNFTNLLSTNIADIKNTQVALNTVYKEHKLFWLKEHVKMAFQHLEHIKLRYVDMKEALASNTPEKMITASEAFKELNIELTQLNKATEGLIDKNNLTDEEVGYTHRIR